MSLQYFLVVAMEWSGLEGSFSIFGLRESLVRMLNVPESEGTVTSEPPFFSSY